VTATLVMIVGLVLTAFAARWLHKSGMVRHQVRRVIAAYVLSLLAILCSFHVVKAEIVPRTAFSVLLVFAAVAYFSVYGYLILKSKKGPAQ
jgi:hypothetical protein